MSSAYCRAMGGEMPSVESQLASDGPPATLTRSRTADEAAVAVESRWRGSPIIVPAVKRLMYCYW